MVQVVGGDDVAVQGTGGINVVVQSAGGGDFVVQGAIGANVVVYDAGDDGVAVQEVSRADVILCRVLVEPACGAALSALYSGLVKQLEPDLPPGDVGEPKNHLTTLLSIKSY